MISLLKAKNTENEKNLHELKITVYIKWKPTYGIRSKTQYD